MQKKNIIHRNTPERPEHITVDYTHLSRGENRTRYLYFAILVFVVRIPTDIFLFIFDLLFNEIQCYVVPCLCEGTYSLALFGVFLC